MVNELIYDLAIGVNEYKNTFASIEQKKSERESLRDNLAQRILDEITSFLITSGKAVYVEENTIDLLEGICSLQQKSLKLNFIEDFMKSSDDPKKDPDLEIKYNHDHMPDYRSINNWAHCYALNISGIEAFLVMENYEIETITLTDTQNEHIFNYSLYKGNLLIPKFFRIYIDGELAAAKLNIAYHFPEIDIIRNVIKQLVNIKYISKEYSLNSTNHTKGKEIAKKKYEKLYEDLEKLGYLNVPTFEDLDNLNQEINDFQIFNDVKLQVKVVYKEEKCKCGMYACSSEGYEYNHIIYISLILPISRTIQLLEISYKCYKNAFDIETSIDNATLISKDKEDLDNV